MAEDPHGGGPVAGRPVAGRPVAASRAATAPRGLSAVGDLVRRYDYDRYLTALFAPPEDRERLLALYAFNFEIAKTREVVSEPMLGQIRLQWWRETIERLYAGEVRRHEVTGPLKAAIEARGLSAHHFETLIAAREEDLDQSPPRDLPAVIDYVDRTAVPLALLGLEAVGVTGPAAVAESAAEGALVAAPEAAQEAAREAARAYALTGLIRAIVFHARDKRQYVPEELVQRTGLSRRDLFELRPSAELKSAVAEMAAEARRRVVAARRERQAVPKAARPILYHASLAEIYLDQLKRAGYDVFDARVQLAPPLRPLRLWLRDVIGRY